MMGLLDLLALRTDRQVRRREFLFLGAPLVPSGLGMSVFWVCHVRVALLTVLFLCKDPSLRSG